jgi:hypothetical protein
VKLQGEARLAYRELQGLAAEAFYLHEIEALCRKARATINEPVVTVAEPWRSAEQAKINQIIDDNVFVQTVGRRPGTQPAFDGRSA